MSGTITEDQYRRLKREVEEAKAEADRARGSLDQLMKRLKDEFGCETLKEAKAKLVQVEAKKEIAQEHFETALRAYEKRWKATP